MPIIYSDQIAQFDGVCEVEEAEELLLWLQDHPEGQLDLATCEHLHSAILQVMLAVQPSFSAVPEPDSAVADIFSACRMPLSNNAR
jgi:hypothetical protein